MVVSFKLKPGRPTTAPQISARLSEILSAATAPAQLMNAAHGRIKQLTDDMPCVMNSAQEAEAAAAAAVQATLTELAHPEKVLFVRFLICPSCWLKSSLTCPSQCEVHTDDALRHHNVSARALLAMRHDRLVPSLLSNE